MTPGEADLASIRMPASIVKTHRLTRSRSLPDIGAKIAHGFIWEPWTT